MNILFFTPFYPPQGEAASTRAFWFCKILQEEGHKLTILNASNFYLRLATNRDRALVRLIRENLAGLELFTRIIISRHDRIILSSPPFFTVLWGALASFLSGQKYILDVRDLYPEVFFELKMIKEHSAAGNLAKLLTKKLYSNAEEIITVTRGLCREISSYKEKSPHLIMNGYDPDAFKPGDDDEKFTDYTIVFHGTLGKLQNVHTLLKVAKELENDDLQIIVAGEGPKAQDILAAQIKNLKFLGNIPYQDVPALLRKCHLGLSFRTDDKIGKEAFPVKVFEYIGSGLPVVMSPPGEAGGLIHSHDLGYEFENSDIEGMVSKIREYKFKGSIKKKGFEDFSRRNQATKLLPLLGKQ